MINNTQKIAIGKKTSIPQKEKHAVTMSICHASSSQQGGYGAKVILVKHRHIFGQFSGNLLSEKYGLIQIFVSCSPLARDTPHARDVVAN